MGSDKCDTAAVMELTHIANADGVFGAHRANPPRRVNDRRIECRRHELASAVYVEANQLQRACPHSTMVTWR